MARRNDLAGLAALGALGLLLNKKQDGSSVPVEDRAAAAATSDTRDTRDYGVDYSEAPTRGRDFMTETEPGWVSGTAPARRPSAGGRTTPSRPSASGYTGAGGSGGGRGPAFGEVEAYRQRQYEDAQRRVNTPEGRAERQRMEESQAIENVYPESQLIAPGAKTIAGLAKGLANRAPRLNEYVQPVIGYAERAKLGYSGGKPTGGKPSGPPPRLEYQVTEKGREKIDNPMAWLAGPKRMESDFKKGGKVKKAAPQRSSASSRGDGIAKRGKTRGRMF